MLASPELQRAQQAMLEYAEQLAKLHGVELDYGIASLANVDKILFDMFNSDVEGKRKISAALKNSLYGIALTLGCYIIEVIERNYGAGTWRKTIDAAGREQLPYTYEDTEIMPVGWCLYALYHGASDNIQLQFQQSIGATKDIAQT